MSNLNDFLTEQMEDPEFREAYETVSKEEDRKLANAMTSKKAEAAARDGMQLTIRAVREDDGTPVFFFNGSFKGQDFSGTANDMSTAWSMATECLELISNRE